MKRLMIGYMFAHMLLTTQYSVGQESPPKNDYFQMNSIPLVSDTSGQHISGPKSTQTAMLLTLGVTIVPTVIAYPQFDGSTEGTRRGYIFLGIGLISGPSMGKFYAKDTKGALIGSAIRLAAGAVTAYGAENIDDEGELFWIGAITGSISLAFDILTTPKSVRKYNERQKAFSLLPRYNSRTKSRGISLIILL